MFCKVTNLGAATKGKSDAICFVQGIWGQNELQVLSTIKQAEEAFGPVDILINGAVLQIRKGVLDLTVEEFRRQLDVSLVGAFLFTKHVACPMIEHKVQGNIITIISTQGHQKNPGNVGYGRAKGGLLNFTRSVAMELAPRGIRVNTLSPTGTDSTEGVERAAAWGVTWGTRSRSSAEP